MSSAKTGKQQVGRFRKGQSGNPAGRPRGSRNCATLAAEALLDGEAEALTRKAIEMALDGDTVALKLCLERIYPPRKDRPVTFPLPPITCSRDAAEALSDLANAASSGQITPSDAEAISKVLGHALKAFEVAELDDRRKVENMTDAELLRVIAMGENGDEIVKQLSGPLTTGPR